MGAKEQSRWGNCFKLSITLKSLKGFKNVVKGSMFFLASARMERFRDLEKIENHCSR